MAGPRRAPITNAPWRVVVPLLIVLFLAFSAFFTLRVVQGGPATRAEPHASSALLLAPKNVLSSGTIRIMPLGDSITMGVNSTDFGGYRDALWNECERAGWNVAFVGSMSNGPASLASPEHEGHPGWRIDQLSAHVVSWLKTYQPQIILLQIGTNDIIQKHAVSSAPMRLRYLITQITTTLPDALVIVAQITPLGNPVLDAEVLTYNKAIPPMVRQLDAQGDHVSYVDMYDAVPLKDITDGIHPDDSGYLFMAHVWYTALESAMRSYVRT